MSNNDAEGGLWLPPGSDTLDFEIAVRQATPTSPHPGFLELALQERRLSPLHDRNDKKYFQTPSRFPEGRFIIWDLMCEYDDALNASSYYTRVPHLPRTLHESRELAHADARKAGFDPDGCWSARSFFPYWFDMQLNRRDGSRSPAASRWDAVEEYLWVARHVLVPRGWTSWLYFPDARQTWGTVPGHDEPVQLPEDFEYVESDAWSLFDRPAT